MEAELSRHEVLLAAAEVEVRDLRQLLDDKQTLIELTQSKLRAETKYVYELKPCVRENFIIHY